MSLFGSDTCFFIATAAIILFRRNSEIVFAALRIHVITSDMGIYGVPGSLRADRISLPRLEVSHAAQAAHLSRPQKASLNRV